MSTPAPNDRLAILAAKAKDAERLIVKARKVWQAAQARFTQLVETHGTRETVTGAAWVDASATYEVYLDAIKLRGDFLRAIQDIKRQMDAARKAIRDRGFDGVQDA